MKVSILSAVALAGFAIAAPLYSRQPQTVRIELQIEEDTFIQENIPIGAVVHTDDNPRLAEGMSARVVSPEGIRCQAFGENDEPLGEPFDEERVQFAAEPIPIGAYFCSPKENGDDEDCEDEREQGNARIQLETSSNTFVQKEVPIGKEVSTKGECDQISNNGYCSSLVRLAKLLPVLSFR